ncbi:MAG: zf-HC2 domain-containing protein, partial [Candidatus Sericytochromatia bacterium]|nr:zf-HC2 domain-containing protein [Candidatus Tanganyikabacteria bacterium]
MRCGTARVFIQETLDGPLSPPDEAMLEAHMAGCEPCRNYRQAMTRVAGALGQMEHVAAPRDFAAAVQFQIGRERNRRRWAPLAAAAAVVVGFVVVRPLMPGGPLQIASEPVAERVVARVAPGIP